MFCSPGVDLNIPNVDECINQHCLDADVFVLVLNATALLSIAVSCQSNHFNFFQLISVLPFISLLCLSVCMFVSVYVCLSLSFVHTQEEDFFLYVSERLSRPNIFVLINCWDLAVRDPDIMDDDLDSTEEASLRKQHLETVVKLLSQELKVTDKEAAVKRVYFVSAKEVSKLLYIDFISCD